MIQNKIILRYITLWRHKKKKKNEKNWKNENNEHRKKRTIQENKISTQTHIGLHQIWFMACCELNSIKFSTRNKKANVSIYLNIVCRYVCENAWKWIEYFVAHAKNKYASALLSLLCVSSFVWVLLFQFFVVAVVFNKTLHDYLHLNSIFIVLLLHDNVHIHMSLWYFKIIKKNIFFWSRSSFFAKKLLLNL